MRHRSRTHDEAAPPHARRAGPPRLAPILVTQVFKTVRRLLSEEELTILLVEQNLHKALVADTG